MAKSHFKINGTNPVTDFNLFDLHGIGLIHQLRVLVSLDIDNIEQSTIALAACGINLAQLMAEGTHRIRGVRIALNCCLKHLQA